MSANSKGWFNTPDWGGWREGMRNTKGALIVRDDHGELVVMTPRGAGTAYLDPIMPEEEPDMEYGPNIWYLQADVRKAYNDPYMLTWPSFEEGHEDESRFWAWHYGGKFVEGPSDMFLTEVDALLGALEDREKNLEAFLARQEVAKVSQREYQREYDELLGNLPND